MSNVINRVSKNVIYSVNTPDYPEVDWIIDPDLSAVQSVPKKYWKIAGDLVLEMDQSEKDAVDAALLPAAKEERKAYLSKVVEDLLTSRHYDYGTRSALNTMYVESVKIKPNRSNYLKPWSTWIDVVHVELAAKQSSVDEQTTLSGVENVIIDTATLVNSDPNKTIKDTLDVVDSNSLSTFLDANVEVTDPVSGVKGPFYLMQELMHRKDLYNDTDNPLYHAAHVPILGSGGILVDHANRVLNLENIHSKLGWHQQQIIKSLYRKPLDLLVYYGWLNSFNSATNSWDNEKVAQDLCKYSIIVIGDGIQNPLHGDYANTQIILPRIKALNTKCIIFGYVSSNQLLANFQTKVTQWNTLQVHGIFIDEAGYDFGTTRAQFNERLDYVHSMTYSNLVFANAWNSDHVIGTANDVSFPNSTYNPSLVASKLTNNDWILLESFPINTTAYGTGYEPKADWLARGAKIVTHRYNFGINIAANGVINNDNLSGSNLFKFGFISALMFSLEAFGTSDTNYGASSAAVVRWTRSDVSNIGKTYDVAPSVTVDSSDSDVYYRYLQNCIMSLDFSTGAQLSKLTSLELIYELPSIDQKDALSGTDGTPSSTNKFVTNSDSRNSNSRTPTTHSHAESEVTNLVTDLTNKASTTDARFQSQLESLQRVFISLLGPGSAGFLLISGTAYFVYLGRVTVSVIPKYVEFHVSTVGAGAQTAEVGLFSSTSAPNKAGLSMTKLVSTETVDSLTSTGVKRNTSAFSTEVSARTYLWAGVRTAMATTQPTIWGLAVDMAQGNILRLTSSGVLTGAGPWSAVIIPAATGVVCPDLRICLD